MKILETSRLILRHPVLDDLDSLYALYCDPEVIKYIPDAPRNYEDTRKELEFMGRCGLLPWTIDGQNEVEVAYLISRAFWGQGLGTEAAQAILDYGFEKLGLSRLICLIDQENTASIKVAEKIGMTFEKLGQDEMGPFLLYSRDKLPVQITK
jgi:RimJ/RimL family protein N-acetyltransferase